MAAKTLPDPIAANLQPEHHEFSHNVLWLRPSATLANTSGWRAPAAILPAEPIPPLAGYHTKRYKPREPGAKFGAGSGGASCERRSCEIP